MFRVIACTTAFAAGWYLARLSGASSRRDKRWPTPVRDAGPSQMRDPPKRWDAQDERSDQSFPASDPPGTY